MNTTPHLKQLVAVLAVRNHIESRKYYEDVLGFTVDHADHEWIMLQRDNVRIHLGNCPDDRPASELGCHSWFATIHVENIEELEKEYLEKGAIFRSRLKLVGDWKDFVIGTPDGHRIVFHHFPMKKKA